MTRLNEWRNRCSADKLLRGDTRFDLDAGAPHYQMRESYQIPVSESNGALQRFGRPMQLNLFDPVFERQFDTELEKRFAYYLDEEKALRWWHRVAVRQQGEYHLRGWRRERIYPDFIAMAGEPAGKPHLLVFETKGEHLRDNPDTEYKRKVLDTLESTFNNVMGNNQTTHQRLSVQDEDRMLLKKRLNLKFGGSIKLQ